MGGIGACCCEECDMALEDLPTVSITGMSVSSDWHWIASCCAQIDFVFDTPPADTVLDAGDVMTYDKTEVCETETFTYDRTCGTITQVFWEQVDPNGRGAIVADVGDEPAYDCCDPLTLTQVHTLTKTVRSRGGQRFVVSLRPIGVCVVIKKVTDYTCAPAGAVTRYVMRSIYRYIGDYSYINYGQLTAVYTTTADLDCWEIPADTSSGYYPFDIDDPNDVVSTGSVDVSFCREKVLTTIPSSETSYTFTITDIPDVGCTFVACIACADDVEICFSSGPTGTEEPSEGFCEATIITEDTDAAYDLQLCLPHKIYFWAETGTCNTLFENMFPDAAPNQQFIQDATICCTEYFADTAFPYHTAAYLAAICAIPEYTYPSWATLTAGGPESGLLGYCEYPVAKFDIGVLNDCWPSQVCDDCPVDSQTGDSDQNLVVAVTTQTVPKSSGQRIVELTRSVSCSGYVEQEVCLPFEEWTIILQEGIGVMSSSERATSLFFTRPYGIWIPTGSSTAITRGAGMGLYVL